MGYEAYGGAGGYYIFQLDGGEAAWCAGYDRLGDAAADYAAIMRGATPSEEGWERAGLDGMADAALLLEDLRNAEDQGGSKLLAEDAEVCDAAFADAVRAAQRTHADFRMEREMLGLSQADVADALGITQRSVQRWEKPGGTRPPAFAWAWLDEMGELFAGMLTAAAQPLEGAPEGAMLGVTYYRSQREYDLCGRDKGYYGMVNAAAREVCRLARGRGIECHAVFPDEMDGSVELARGLTR